MLPVMHHVLLLFISVAMVVSEFFLGVVNPVIAYLMIVAIAGAVSLVINIGHDLDNPFAGEWNVSFREFGGLVGRRQGRDANL